MGGLLLLIKIWDSHFPEEYFLHTNHNHVNNFSGNWRTPTSEWIMGEKCSYSSFGCIAFVLQFSDKYVNEACTLGNIIPIHKRNSR